MEHLHLVLETSIDELERLGSEVSAFCSRNGLDEQLRYTLQLVCDEWVSNVVMHGFGGSPPAKDASAIELWLRRTDEETLELVFCDGGPPFNPTAHPDPDVTLPLEQRQAGGLGIHMIRRMTDHVEYKRVDGRNRLVLIKKIRSREGEETDERNC